MSDPILDLIDGAIWDYGDAMRWTPEPTDGEVPAFTGPTYADISSWFEVPVGLIDCDSPPRGIITALPQQPAREPDLLADFRILFRRLEDYVEPEVDTHGRVPYLRLDENEREALHQWCIHHKVDYKQVPVDGLIDLDPATREWRIEVYRHTREGKCYLDEAGDIARAILRRAHKTDLPWRRP